MLTSELTTSNYALFLSSLPPTSVHTPMLLKALLHINFVGCHCADREVYANINTTAFPRPYHWPNVIELITLYRILLKLIGIVRKLKCS